MGTPIHVAKGDAVIPRMLACPGIAAGLSAGAGTQVLVWNSCREGARG